MVSARIMKPSLQKSSSLSLVSADPCLYDSPTEEKGATLKESFDNWVNAGLPTLLCSTAAERRQSANRRPRTLTSADIMRVDRATVRESTDHRHWPPEVVSSFLAADVIKRKQG